MTKILNIKGMRSTVSLSGAVAYCGLSPDYWIQHYPIIQQMIDLSVLGKPRHLIIKGNRPATIENYRAWLWSNIRRKDIADALRRVGRNEFDAVACWCTPLKCHCEVILSAAKWLVADDNLTDPS